MKVFLGGTCNGSKWREKLIEMLEIDYFNPVVEEWTEECMKEEIKQREICDYCLYVITPLMTGVYSIAEVIDDSNKRNDKTLFCFLEEDGGKRFTESQIKSLNQVGKMVERNAAICLEGLNQVAAYLNGAKRFRDGLTKHNKA
jgi:hypothetical protein